MSAWRCSHRPGVQRRRSTDEGAVVHGYTARPCCQGEDVPGVHVGVSHVLDWKWHLHATLTQGLGAQCLACNTAIWRMCIDERRQHARHDKRSRPVHPRQCLRAAQDTGALCLRCSPSGRRCGQACGLRVQCREWLCPVSLAPALCISDVGCGLYPPAISLALPQCHARPTIPFTVHSTLSACPQPLPTTTHCPRPLHRMAASALLPIHR